MDDVWQGVASDVNQPNTGDVWSGLASPVDQQPQGFLSRVGTDLSNRNQMMQNTASQYNMGNLSAPEALLQGVGKGVAGSVNDVMGEGLKTAINYTPDFIKQPIANAGNALLNTDIGQGAVSLAKQGMNAYSSFAQNHPRISGDLESVGNIGGLALGAGLGTKPALAGAEGVGNVLVKSGETVANLGQQSLNNSKNAFIKDLVSPKITPSVAADQFSRSTEKGLFRTATVNPTPQETDIINTVSQLPVSKSNSMLKNYNIITDAKNSEAQNLINSLKANDVAIPDDHIINTLSGIRTNLAKSPYITGNGATAADKVMDIALGKITENPQTASGLLQARKDFDAEIMRLKGENTFSPELDSPVSTAVQQIRQGINNMVDASVPDANVKASLRKQSNLYRAMDNIETKGGAEGKNIFSRFAQRAGNLVPIKSAVGKGAAIALGAGTTVVAPALVGTGLAAYGGYKSLPYIAKAAGKTLSTTGKLMGGRK